MTLGAAVARPESGGGTIIFGVAETRVAGVSAVDHVEPAGVIDDTVLQQIRQVAGELIYPPVVSQDLLPLAPGDDPAGGLLALVVPDSVAMPHLVHPDNTKNSEDFIAPSRLGVLVTVLSPAPQVCRDRPRNRSLVGKKRAEEPDRAS